MSSAILYLAIIAIWACVLVPRWIHKPHRILPEPEKLFGLQYSAAPGAPDAETGEMAGDGWDDRGDSTEVLPGVAGQGTALDHGAAPQNGVPAEQGVAWHRITERRTYHATGPAPGSRPVPPPPPRPPPPRPPARRPGAAPPGPVPRRPGTTSAADHAGHAHDRGPGGHGREALSRVVPGASGRHARRVSAAAARGHACRRGAGTVASTGTGC